MITRKKKVFVLYVLFHRNLRYLREKDECLPIAYDSSVSVKDFSVDIVNKVFSRFFLATLSPVGAMQHKGRFM